jgi:hypothetical protein
MDKYIKWAYDKGYFWKTNSGVDLDDLNKLTFEDKEVKEAFAELQDFHFGTINWFTAVEHGRSIRPDGDVGPATIRMIDTLENPDNQMFNRCPIPDVAPPENASFHYDDDDVQIAVESYQLCWEDGKHIVYIGVDSSTMPSHVKGDVWEAMKKNNQDACAGVGLIVRYQEKGKPSDINLRWKYLAGSTIGLAQFPSGSCTDEVFHYMDPGYRSSTKMLSVLHIHECGHNWKLGHTRGGIMNPSIINVPMSWKSPDPSWRTMAKFFGGVSVTDIPTEPEPPVDPENPQEIEVVRFTDEGRQYILKKMTGEGPDDDKPIIWF